MCIRDRFTTVELYQAYTDFNGMMDLFEDLLSSAAQKILGTYQLEWQGEQIDLTPGWPRLTMHEAVKQYTGIDFMAISSDEAVSYTHLYVDLAGGCNN